MARPSDKDRLIEQVKTLYVEEEKSLGEIREITGKSQQTLSRWLQDEGVTIVPRPRNPNEGRTPEQQAVINAKVSASRKGKGAGPRTVKEKRRCPQCTTDFEPTYGDQVCCSMKCARAADAEKKAAETRATYEADPKRCPCGKAIPYEVRHRAKYCDSDCRKEYGSYRKEDPSKWGIFTCEADSCGKEYRRRIAAGGTFRYCSRACADRHTKVKKHIVVDDAVVLDSAYESLFWSMCTVLKIRVDRYDREQGVDWNGKSWYAPDFLVTWQGRQVAVETKGFADENDEKRWTAFREQATVPLVVLTRDELVPLPATREDLLKLLDLA